MKTKVAIIGGAAQERFFNLDEETEVWGLNANRPKWIPRWDRMFNLHAYENLVRYIWPVEREYQWAKKRPDVPFYVTDPWPAYGDERIVKQIVFPRAEMERTMPRGRYHCGSIDWLVAFAIFAQFKEIKLHGVNLVSSDEPISSRACLEYWCGYAEGSKVTVSMANDCHLFRWMHVVMADLVYGYDDTPLIEDRINADGKPPYTWENLSRSEKE